MKLASEGRMREALARLSPDELVDVFQKMGWHRPGEPHPSDEERDRILTEAFENCASSPGFANMFTQALGIEPDGEANIANVETDVNAAYEAERAKRRAAAKRQKMTIWAVVTGVVIVVIVIVILL